MIYVRKVIGTNSDFIKECYWNYYDYNSPTVAGSLLEEISEVFIVNNGTKDIGMFTVHVNDHKTDASVLLWMHNKSCKMGLLQVVKAAAYYIYNFCILERIDFVFFYVKDLLSAKAVCRIFKHFRYYILAEKKILCFLNTKDIDGSILINKKLDVFELDV